MIPIRIQADFVPPMHGPLIVLVPDHPLISEEVGCPACDGLFDATRAIVLVPVGIAPRNRTGQWTTGGAVAVHAECARPLTAQEAADELARLGKQFDMLGQEFNTPPPRED